MNAKHLVLIILGVAFISYSGVVYTYGTEQSSPSPAFEESIVRGKLLWQEKNCIACHQLYGLGGYLGPDLTHVTGNPQKGFDYAKVIIRYGTGRMPRFQLTEQEADDIASFLQYVDASTRYEAQL